MENALQKKDLYQKLRRNQQHPIYTDKKRWKTLIKAKVKIETLDGRRALDGRGALLRLGSLVGFKI